MLGGQITNPVITVNTMTRCINVPGTTSRCLVGNCVMHAARELIEIGNLRETSSKVRMYGGGI